MWLLKECSDILSPFLCALCNTSLRTGAVPVLFKTAVITPLIKKSSLDVNTLQNYRPISNLSFVSKLLERLVTTQLQSHVDTHLLLPPNQSAYRRGHSTETALLRVFSDLISALDCHADNQSVLAVLDMTAAFDTVDHSILLQRLERSYGISGNALQWFTSYLSDRYQSVRIRDKQSSVCHVPYGVPQGSVLGPLLFILYIADAATFPGKHGLSSHFYADDIQLYLSCRQGHTAVCASRVSACIDDIIRWMASNRLMVNPAKTDILWCSTNKPPPDTPLSPSGTTVQPSSSLRNLGVFFESDLSLASHVNQLTARCYSSLRRIKSCRRALTRSASVTLVNSLIVSRLDYCNSLLAGCSKQLVDKLQRVLNCAARVIFGGDRRDHVTPLLRDKLHWLRARERITFKLCLLVYKATNGLAPSYIQDLCVPVTTISIV